MNSIYETKINRITGEPQDFEEYRGKVLLIVNTASKCGFTPQFEGLQKLYEDYKDQGFVVLGFPCSQFMNQEFENAEETASFCRINYGVTFPMFEKIDVNGENQHPLYRYLKEQQGGIFGSKIKWNFTKFLVDREGNVVDRFAPKDTPDKLRESIEKLL